MSVTFKVVDTSPASNPNKITLHGTFAGNYGVQGVGDPANLAPYSAGNNAGGFTNPENLALPSLPVWYEQAPAVKAENLDGYYLQVTPAAPAAGATNGVANTVAPINGFGIRVFAPGGAELATDAAYPAAVLAGDFLLELQLPHDQ